MKKILSTILLMLLLVGTLAACAETPEPEAPTPPIAEETPEPAEETPAPEEEENGYVDIAPLPIPTEGPATLEVQVVTDEILGQFDNYHAFSDPEEEGEQRIIITTDYTVVDFRFLEITVEFNEHDEVEFIPLRSLETMVVLSADMPFVVNWMTWGTFPHRGLSYVDENGETRYFFIDMSAATGELLLEEF